MSVKDSRSSLALFVAVALLGALRAEEKALPLPKKGKDIVDIVAGDKNFSTLAAAVKAAELVGDLKAKGPFTMFAPNDSAFAKLPKGTVEALLKDKKKLATLLKYHVLAGRVPAAQALKLDGKSAKTLAGKEVGFAVKGKALVLNGKAKVVRVDIKATNGVIHVIDTVLLPPE
jgi:uncharacterized surface protein with fasciclin (FAS1) repeats